ncbi:MAG: DUF732 domain-containing protein [Rhodococcus sp.]|nr:DUF732 domain-containing protein [Rhodococcus sp. (in: high G+C Gram-positive bacteria)]
MQARRFRTSVARALMVGALAVTGGGLLAACGSDDSTASGSPSSSAAQDSTTTPPVTSPGEAATAPPTEPTPLPDDFPGPAEVPVSDEGQAFLDALRARGIQPAADGSIAVSTADYICQAQRQGLSADDTKVFVTAMVGAEASATGEEITPEDADANAQTYIEVAHASYCR